MVEFDDEAYILFGKILMHYDKITGTMMPPIQILKKVLQNEIDSWQITGNVPRH
jgi:hypothetical protein